MSLLLRQEQTGRAWNAVRATAIHVEYTCTRLMNEPRILADWYTFSGWSTLVVDAMAFKRHKLLSLVSEKNAWFHVSQ